MRLPENERLLQLACWLHGYGSSVMVDGKNVETAEKLIMAADNLKKYSERICGQGYICSGGSDCESSHK